MSLKLLPWTAAPAPTPTVGEVTAKAGIPRAALWFVAVYFPSIPFIGLGGIAYSLCSKRDTTFSSCVRRDLWRLTPLMLWAAYMSLLALVSMHMRLFLPRAPNAVLTDLVEVGMKWIGSLLSLFACLGYILGVTWVIIVVNCVFLIIIAHVLAIWARLVRMYGFRD